MALSPDDRKAFSLKIVTSTEEIATFQQAKAKLLVDLDKAQKLDDANKNLYDPVNVKTNQYQVELQQLNGIVRSTYIETNIHDSAERKIGNYFFPNDIQITVPSLSGVNNVWVNPKPFALTFSVGKNYVEVYPGSSVKEGDKILDCTTLITSAFVYPDIERTTGLTLSPSGTCSNPMYTDQATCELNSGIWTPSGGDDLVPSTAVINIKNSLVTAVNALKTFLQTEVALIVTDDKDSAIQAQNNTAISNINTIIIPALNTWLAYPDFNATGVTEFNYNFIDPNTLAPTKLHTTQLTALSNALSARTSFISTRTSQLLTVLGTIVQNLTNGLITSSSGYYGRRYDFLLLRLDMFTGSLTKVITLQRSIAAQESVIASITTNKNTYMSVVPTTLFAAPGSNTSVVHLVDASFLSPGDTVFVMAETQVELQRAVKSVTGNVVILNDVVPAKYNTTDKLRLYKDIS